MLFALVGILPGCLEPVADFGEVREAWRVEQAGEYHRAYELYCRAAEKNPGSPLLAMAIDRTASSAANYYEDRAHRAVDRGDYAEAWRLFMRVLDIRPDHPSAPHLIRRLERDHPQAIAVVKSAYMILGPAALSSPSGSKSVTAQTEPARTTEVAMAQGDEPRNPSAVTVAPHTTPLDDATADRRARVRRAFGETTAPPVKEGSEGGLIYPAQQEKTVRAEDAGPSERASLPTSEQDSAEVERVPDAEPRPVPVHRPGDTVADRPAQRPAPKRGEKRPSHTASLPTAAVAAGWPVVEAADEGPTASKAREVDSEVEHRPSPPERRSPYQFMVVRTLSKKDPHFPKKAEVLDGLTLELRDTDDDLSADLTVFLGSRQIAKLKEIKIGQPHVIVGRSGRVYELVVLRIDDSRQTARIGVRAASEPGSR